MTRAYKAGRFFTKHANGIWKNILIFYRKFFLRGNRKRIDFYRGQGATIGDNVTLGWDELGSEPFLVEIGDNTYISSAVRMFTHDGGIMQLKYMGLTEKKYDNFGMIKIGKNCFIGAETIILKNVTIGDNCIIGAGSVVTKSIPSGYVAAGVPAKTIETVEEYCKKNEPNFDDTIGWPLWDKRNYIEKNKEKYEKIRKEKECSDKSGKTNV